MTDPRFDQERLVVEEVGNGENVIYEVRFANPNRGEGMSEKGVERVSKWIDAAATRIEDLEFEVARLKEELESKNAALRDAHRYLRTFNRAEANKLVRRIEELNVRAETTGQSAALSPTTAQPAQPMMEEDKS